MIVWKRNISKDVTAQIASYAYHPGPQLTILSKSVQQQGNGVDCGVYAIAFTTSRAYGSNPGKESYDEKKIRPHLVECLKIGKLTPFPSITGEFVRCDTATSIIELYYLCRVPYTPPTDERHEMAQCNQYKEWFHRVCEKIPAVAFENLRKKHGIVLFAVTDISNKNDKYILPLTLSCQLVAKGHTHTWANLQLLSFFTTRHVSQESPS